MISLEKFAKPYKNEAKLSMLHSALSNSNLHYSNLSVIRTKTGGPLSLKSIVKDSPQFESLSNVDLSVFLLIINFETFHPSHVHWRTRRETLFLSSLLSPKMVIYAFAIMGSEAEVLCIRI